MFSTHLFYKEGSRPGMIYPYCEKENADIGASDGQCGSNIVTRKLREVSCPYCQWEKLKEVYVTFPKSPRVPPQSLPIHWSIHPVFSTDGCIRLLRWDAICGEVKISPEYCLGTRKSEEVTCLGCRKSL